LYHIFNGGLFFALITIPLLIYITTLFKVLEIIGYILISIIVCIYLVQLLVTYKKVKNTSYNFYENEMVYKCDCFYSMEKIIKYKNVQTVEICEKNKIKKFMGLGMIIIATGSWDYIHLSNLKRFLLFLLPFNSEEEHRFEGFFRPLQSFIKGEYAFNGIILNDIKDVQVIYNSIRKLIGANTDCKLERRTLFQGETVPKKVFEISSTFHSSYELKYVITSNLLGLSSNMNVYSLLEWILCVIINCMIIFTIIAYIKIGFFILRFEIFMLLFSLIFFCDFKSCVLESKKLEKKHRVNFVNFFEDHLVYTNEDITVLVKYEDVLSVKIMQNPLQKKYHLCTLSFSVRNAFVKNENIGDRNLFLGCVEMSDENFNRLKALIINS